MSEHIYPHRLHYHIRFASGSDDRAPGGAVTVALCGHWNHDGPCRWPHHSSISLEGGGRHLLVVQFDASGDDVETVKTRIGDALRHGRLTGPDGRHSVWKIES
jgi:hypothetical protein